MEDPLERKVTAPDVARPPEAETVAVKTTLEPKAGLVADAVSTVLVAAVETVTSTAFEADAAKAVVPP
jgi:hypothetical protein